MSASLHVSLGGRQSGVPAELIVTPGLVTGICPTAGAGARLPLPDDDARLGEIVGGNGVPIKGLLLLGAGVAWDVTKGLVLGKS